MMIVTRNSVRKALIASEKQKTGEIAGVASSIGKVPKNSVGIVPSNKSKRKKSSTNDQSQSGSFDDNGKQAAMDIDSAGHVTPSVNTAGPSRPREPTYWRQHLENIRSMRVERSAAVDSMGAHACVDPKASEHDKRYQILIALMLSSQTKDEVTSSAMRKLRELPKGCTPSTILCLTQKELEQLIYPVGFYKRKAEYIKRATEILMEKFDGQVPSDYDQLCTLPGVGPKMATLAMNLAFGQIVGVGVDTHVHRVANRLGWTLTPASTPERTKVALEKWLPNDLWEEINVLLVGFGQQVCTPIRPKCEDCLNNTICPYALSH